jgi:hypothetical protein
MGQVRQWTNDLISTRLVIRLSAGILFPITQSIGITSTCEFIQQAKRIIQILQHIFRRANLIEFISIHPTPH